MNKTLALLVAAFLFTGSASRAQRDASAPPVQGAPSAAFQSVPQKGHTGLIQHLEYSKDGRFILTGSLDGTARLWDARSNLLVRVFDAKDGAIQVAFVPDGKRIITHDRQGKLLVFDLYTGALQRTVSTHWSYFPRIRPFADGHRVLVANENKYIQIVDIDTGQMLKQFNECPNDPYPRSNVDLSPDNRFVISACFQGQVQVRDLETDRRVATYDTKEKTPHGVAFVGDGRLAVIFHGRDMAQDTKNSGIDLWDWKSGAITTRHKLPKKLEDFAISPDQKTVAFLIDTSLATGEVELRDLSSFKLLEHFSEGVGNNAGIVHVSPDGKTLVAPGDLSSVAMFDIASKKHTGHLSSEDAGGIRKIARRSNRWQVATASGDGNVYLFDIASASLRQTFSAGVEYVTALDYSPDGRFVATVDLTNPKTYTDHPFMGARIWDVATGEQISKNIQVRSIVRAAHFSADGKLLLLGDRKQILVKETKTWRTISKIPNVDDPYSISLTKDNARAAISSSFAERGVFDLRTGKKLASFPMERTHYAYYLPDGNRILLISDQGRVELWDLAGNRRLRTFAAYETNKERVLRSTAELSDDGTRFIGVSQSNTLDIWDVETGALLTSMSLPQGKFSEASFLPNPDYVAAPDAQGALRVWNLKTKASMAMVADGKDWIVYTDDGYFDGSRRGGRLVATVNGLSSFRIDQMAARNNRPDIILSRMGLGSPEILAHYQALYQRRLKKMGLNADDLDNALAKAPTVAVTSVTNTGRTAAIQFEARDDSADLVRYNVYVNDVPIFGAAGKPLSGRLQRISESVALGSGDNKIEVGVLNRTGLESMRPNVVVTYPEGAPSDLYYLAFGVSRYKNDALNLKYAAKDATDLAAALAKKRSFAKIHSTVYTDEAVTIQSIQDAKAFLSTAKVDDTVVLFIAGHGLYAPNPTPDYFFLTHQTDLNRIAQTAVPFELLEDLLQGIAPRKKLFLLDTCYSGEEGKDASAELFAAAGSRGLASRGIQRTVLDGSGIPRDQHLFAQRDRYIYNDLFRRSGAIVLSSSRGSELSYEKDDIQNGLFTEYVLRALSTTKADVDKDRQVSTDELRDFVSKSVSTASGGLQNPVVDRDNLEMRFALPLQ